MKSVPWVEKGLGVAGLPIDGCLYCRNSQSLHSGPAPWNLQEGDIECSVSQTVIREHTFFKNGIPCRVDVLRNTHTLRNAALEL